MRRKAQEGIGTIKTLILLLVIAALIFMVTLQVTKRVNESRTSNLCLVSISLMSEGKGELNCDRNINRFKKLDFAEMDKLKRNVATDVVSCSKSVGFGKQNPFDGKDLYSTNEKSVSNCVVCSDLEFEKDEKIKELLPWSVINSVPGSEDSFFFRMTGHNPSEKLTTQLQDLKEFAFIDTSKDYRVFWQVHNKDRLLVDGFWVGLLDAYEKGEPIPLKNNKGTNYEYKLLGSNLDELVIVGTDFFGFVVHVGDDPEFVSSIWVGTDEFLLSNFNGENKIPKKSERVCHYIHN